MRKVQDHYFKKAKRKGFVARSVFKLEEIDRANKLIRKGDRVLDLGCFPGSWSQYISGQIGPTGLIVGVDIQELTQPLGENTRFIHADINNLDVDELTAISSHWDLVCSDMAPKTTGIKDVDTARSIQLCESALSIANRLLGKKGRFLVKVFQGSGFDQYMKTVRSMYNTVKTIKPKSTRSESREIYVLGIHKKI